MTRVSDLGLVDTSPATINLHAMMSDISFFGYHGLYTADTADLKPNSTIAYLTTVYI